MSIYIFGVGLNIGKGFFQNTKLKIERKRIKEFFDILLIFTKSMKK
jgi:hypothetical protein